MAFMAGDGGFDPRLALQRMADERRQTAAALLREYGPLRRPLLRRILRLNVGGSLQHGAIVARELGKPCVVGIGGVTARLEDGQHVEVDGGTGRVRLLDAAP